MRMGTWPRGVQPRLDPCRTRHFVMRFVAGAIAIAVFSTVAAGALAIGTIDTIAADLSAGVKPISSPELKPASDGAPQTILVIGDDHSGNDTTQATGTLDQGIGVKLLHADTFMLVRVDPAQGQISILSVPRDLMISFTNRGNCYRDVRFNTAYAVGGVDQVLAEVKTLLPGVTVDHVIDFNFSSFLGGIKAIGCVYVDVDRQCYNPPNDGYPSINIQPG
jgi:LCP family protein required for cell wall assembly